MQDARTISGEHAKRGEPSVLRPDREAFFGAFHRNK
jgi:hypothetical protein